MKRLHYIFMVGALSLMMTSCAKDDEKSVSDASYNTFKINLPSLKSDTKAYLDFTSSLSRILYEVGDVIYVNGVPFSLRKEGDGSSAVWYADRDDNNPDDVYNNNGYFYCCYADGTVTGSGPNYNVDIEENLSSTTGIVLAGSTESNIITLTPTFAVLVFNPANISDYTSVKVGFQNNKVPMIFTVSASEENITGASGYFTPVSTSDPNPMLTMHKVDNSYYYVAVPIVGTSASTKLYIQYTKVGVNDPYQRVTTGEVTLEKGHVYVIPSEDMSSYPFDENGASKKVFSVSATQTVKFSAGNLQCNPSLYSDGFDKGMRFAPHQYDMCSEGDNQNISSTHTAYMDLFGWATSGYVLHPYETSTNSSTYRVDSNKDYDMYGSQTNLRYDWGYYNYNNIWYGNTSSYVEYSNRWRTLTSDEWYYLLNTRSDAANKRGYATINGINGFVILPDVWNQPAGVSFTPDGQNNYNIQEWNIMEKAGAIFLPACGSRYGIGVGENGSIDEHNGVGKYWSSTHSSSSNAYAFTFTSSSFNANASCGRRYGQSVRLVINAN